MDKRLDPVPPTVTQQHRNKPHIVPEPNAWRSGGFEITFRSKCRFYRLDTLRGLLVTILQTSPKLKSLSVGLWRSVLDLPEENQEISSVLLQFNSVLQWRFCSLIIGWIQVNSLSFQLAWINPSIYQQHKDRCFQFTESSWNWSKAQAS